ncbi:Protein insensitive [Dissostichus eleginoides]|uniref:Protein insensitive n=1 Tax=Dissostichus eleginoides TaxID=100907 RepID=A0AAD9FL31_DISEL|nr:Protein insensitive [Dissostichus eleginoides]
MLYCCVYYFHIPDTHNEKIVTCREDLDLEQGWIEVIWPAKCRPQKESKPVAAKLLFVGEVYQEVVQKRDAFIRGEDISSVAESQKRGSRRKTWTVKKVKEAMVTAMGEQLKRSLQAERTSKPSEEKEPACQQHPQKVWVELDKDTLEALKEMPRLVATMKAALDKISGSSSSGSCSSSGDSQQTGRNTGSNDLMFLGNSSVQVSTRLFQRLGNRRMSLFTQELATLIFGNETLAKSTLTGKGKSAETLDPEKVNAIIDTVRGKYPGTEVSTIRALLRRKCNNESYKTNIPPK